MVVSGIDILDGLLEHTVNVRHHIVQPGENLTSLAKHYYGSTEKRYALAIFHANNHVICNPRQIFPGQRLVIPHIPHVASWHRN